MKMTYIQRDLEKTIKKHLPLPQIIAIVGPRRSGKTTLLLHLKEKLKDCLYLSFEDQKILDFFDQDIENFAKLYFKNKYLILDEFHYAKNGGKNLKYLFDFYPGKKIIISGSSALELTVRAIKYLVGRIVVFPLLPFSFLEFLKTKERGLCEICQQSSSSLPLLKKLNSYLEEYLLYGGYPEVVLQKDTEIKKTLLTNIYSLYFLKEVRDFLGLIEDYKLKNLLKALSLQIGNLCQHQELSQIAELSQPTLKKYLRFLEKTFVCFFIKPFFTNKRTELTKNPKVYFFDLGLRNAVLDNFLPLNQRGDSGAILENFVALNLKKNFGELCFWRTKSKAEVDFVVEKEGEITPIEVKMFLDKPKVGFSLLSFIKKYQPQKAFVFSLNFSGKRKIKKTTVNYLLPWTPHGKLF